MRRLTTDDLLREATETRLVRRSEVIPLLLDAVRDDAAVREQLAQLMISVADRAKPQPKPGENMRGFAWLPTFAWERDGDTFTLKVTDVAKVPFHLRALDKEGNAYDVTFGENGVYAVPEGALDLPS